MTDYLSLSASSQFTANECTQRTDAAPARRRRRWQHMSDDVFLTEALDGPVHGARQALLRSSEPFRKTTR